MNYDDVYELCRDKDQLRNWLLKEKLIGELGGLCQFCAKGRITLRKDSSFSKDGVCWRCSDKNCGKKSSIRQDSWFSQSHLTLDKIVKLTYYWVYKYPEELVLHELRIGSEHTTVDWYNFAREVCVEILEKHSTKIGGPGKTVEIDESKFGKRKYHRGRRVDGVWVFGGIERESKRSFFRTVEHRDAETLLPILKEFVLPGTTIISDCWKAYCSLESEGYIHLTVNHSKEFVNKETGACTNTIESTWHAVKNSLPRYGTVKSLYESYFVEYCVRKQYLNNSDDKFKAFLDLIKTVYPVKKRQVLCPVHRVPQTAQPQPHNNSLDDFDI